MSCVDRSRAALGLAVLVGCGPGAEAIIALGLERTPADAATVSVFVTDVAEERVVASATVSAQRLGETIALGVPAEALLEIAAVARTSSGVPSWVAYREERVPLRREPTIVELTLRPAGVLVLDTTHLDEEIRLEPEHRRERGWILAPEVVHRRVVEQGRWMASSDGPLEGAEGIWVERRGASFALLGRAKLSGHRELLASIKDARGVDREIGAGEPFFVELSASRPSHRVTWRFTDPSISTGGQVSVPVTLGPFSHEGYARFIAVDEATFDVVSAVVGVASNEVPARVELSLFDPERLGLGTWLSADVLDVQGRPVAEGELDIGDSDPHLFAPDGHRVQVGPAGAVLRVVRASEPLDRAAVVRARVEAGTLTLRAELELPRIAE